MMQVTVLWDTREVERKLNAIKAGLGDRAITSAINKVAAQAKTQMSKAIREDYNISAALVNERLRLRKATRSGVATFTAILIGNPETGGRRRSMNLVHFLEKSTSLAEARKRGKAGTLAQLHFKIRKTGGKAIVRGAFIGNQGRTVFIREGAGRLPIKAVRTIGVPQMFSTRKNIGKIKVWIGDNFPRILQSEVKYFLSTVT